MFSLITVFLEVLSIALIIPFISLILAPEKMIMKFEAFLNDWNLEIYFLDFLNFESTKYYLIVVFFFVYLFKNIFIITTKYLEFKFVREIELEVSIKILNKYFHQKYEFFIKNNSSILISRLTHDMIALVSSYLRPLILIFTESLIVISVILIIFFLNLFKLALIFFSIFLVGIIILKLTTSNIKTLGHQRMIYDQKRLNTLTSSFKNIIFIILDNQFSSIINYYREIISKLTNFKKISDFHLILPKYIFEILGILSICVIIIYLSINSYQNDYILSSIGFLFAVAYRLMPSIQKIVYSVQNITYGQASVKAILENLSLSEKNRILETDKHLKFENEINLKDINFSYDNRNKKVFENANLKKLKKGSSVGIFGNSGAGKSTLVDLISCLKEIEIGDLLVDNKQIKNIEDIRAWQNKISYISQNTFLMDDTIKNNICSSSYEKKLINHQKFKDVISISKLNKFIDELPQKEETIIGEEAISISGGQKKIAIARALYKDPEILILDEATNGLDLKVENEIIDTVLNLKNKITIIIISHNLKIIQKCEDL